MKEILGRIRRHHGIVPIFFSNFFFFFHYILVVYINSSFLKSFFSPARVSFLYAFSAILSILCFLAAPRIVQRIGSFRFLLSVVLLEIAGLFVLSQAGNPILIAIFFIIHYISTFMIVYGLDIFFETIVKSERSTGTLRGLYLTLANIAIIAGPLLISLLAEGDRYARVYAVSAFLLLPVLALVFFSMKKIGTAHVSHVDLHSLLRDLRGASDTTRIIAINFLLQFFYSWMVVYTPIYLHEVIGFSWATLGVVFSIMLVPFILIEAPAGMLADKKIGEKEILYAGIAVLVLSTAFLPFLHAASIVLWTLALFATRIGASMTEIGTDTFFFKHVTGRNANLMSAYRAMIPAAFVAAPLVFTLASGALGMRYSYFVLAAVLSLGFFAIRPLTDTR